MNLADLTLDAGHSEAVVGGQDPSISAFIHDRNPVLSQCLSTSLSVFPTLDCHALSFNENTLTKAVGDTRTQVYVFDPAQIKRTLSDFLRNVTGQDSFKAVAYSFDTSDVMVNRALDAGVDCYASKEEDMSVLYLAIATAAHGGRFLCPTIAQSFYRVHETPPVEKQSEADPKSLLSSRELAVIRALASGLSQKQTAFELCLSDKTVSTYKSRAMRKLGLTDRASIVKFAISQNMIAQYRPTD